MRTRARIHPYVATDVARRLTAYCAAKGLTESAAVQAAIEQYLDAGEKDNALILRRLDRLGRAATRQQRDLEVLSEAFAVYVRFWCAYLPAYSSAEMDAARRAGGQRYERFVEHVSDQLAAGQRLASRVVKEDSSATAEPLGTKTQGPPTNSPR
jgi:hypothetical protein